MAENQVKQEAQKTAVGTEMVNFWEANGKKMAIALGILLVLAGGVYGYQKLVSAPAETKAAEALFKAENYFREDSVKLALNGDNMNPGFLKVISKYSGTNAANLAHFYAGSCYMKLGDYNNAVKHLKEFSTGAPQIQAKATALLGDAYSEQNKKEDAIDAYKKAASLFDKDEFNSPEYLFRAGYLYESMGKNKEAIEMYKIIKEKYPRSERGYTIDKYLARLGEISE